MSEYITTVSVDYTNHPKNRVAVLNYGHWHTYGHVTKEQNGNFNIIQHPNMLSQYFDKIGNPSGSQFTTQIIDTINRKVTNLRFSPTREIDTEFTLDY